MPSGKQLPPYPEIYRLPELMKMTFPEPLWVIPGLVAQGFSVLAGKPKLGKSLLCFTFGLACAGGGAVLGKIRVPQVGVLYMALEDTFQSIQERAVLLTNEGRYPEALRICHDWPRMDQSGLELLGDYLTKNPDIKYVLIDDYSHFRPRVTKARTLYQEDNEISSAIKKLADDYNVSITATHHTRKAAADDIMDTLNSSQGMGGAVDQTFVLERGRYSDEGKLSTMGRKGFSKQYALRFDPQLLTWALVGEADTVRESQEDELAVGIVNESDWPLTHQEVAAIRNERRPDKPLKETTVKWRLWKLAKHNPPRIQNLDGKYWRLGNTDTNAPTLQPVQPEQLQAENGQNQGIPPYHTRPAKAESGNGKASPVGTPSSDFQPVQPFAPLESLRVGPVGLVGNVRTSPTNAPPPDTAPCLVCGRPVPVSNPHLACDECRAAETAALASDEEV